jgi:hypothetical protein
MAPSPPSHMETGIPSQMKDRAEDIQPPILGRQEEVEGALKSPSILPKHRAILGAAFNQFRYAEARIMEAFISLAKGFEVNFL